MENKNLKLLTFDSGRKYIPFKKKYGEDPREYISTTFSKAELLEMMQLPYARKVFESTEELEEFIADAHLYDIAVKIIDECFSPDKLMQATEEMLHQKRKYNTEYVAHDPHVDYTLFKEKYGDTPEKYLAKTFTKKELLKMMRLPYIAIDYGSEQAWKDFIAASDKQDIIDEIMGEWFSAEDLMRAAEEIKEAREKE